MDRRIERTRTAVVEAAVALAERGGPAMGMTEIATAAGVSRKAVYENFGSRDEVLRSCTRWLLRDVVPAGVEEPARGSSAWDTALAPIVAHMARRRDYYRSVLSGPASAAARDAVVDHAAGELRSERQRRHELADGSDDGAGDRRDRFVAHGLVGVVADALLQRSDADLTALFRELEQGCTATAPCR